MVLSTRSGVLASTGVCSCKETIPDPGVLNRELLRKAWTLLKGSSIEMRVLLLLNSLLDVQGWALLTRWHCWLLHTPREPSPARGLCSLPGETAQVPSSLGSCIPTPAGPLVHHGAHSVPQNECTHFGVKYTALLYIHKHPNIQKRQSLFSCSY